MLNWFKSRPSPPHPPRVQRTMLTLKLGHAPILTVWVTGQVGWQIEDAQFEHDPREPLQFNLTVIEAK